MDRQASCTSHATPRLKVGTRLLRWRGYDIREINVNHSQVDAPNHKGAA